MKTFFGTVIGIFCFVAGRAKPWFIFLAFISCGLVECAFWKLCFALLLMFQIFSALVNQVEIGLSSGLLNNSLFHPV